MLTKKKLGTPMEIPWRQGTNVHNPGTATFKGEFLSERGTCGTMEITWKLMCLFHLFFPGLVGWFSLFESKNLYVLQWVFLVPLVDYHFVYGLFAWFLFLKLSFWDSISKLWLLKHSRFDTISSSIFWGRFPISPSTKKTSKNPPCFRPFFFQDIHL